MSEICVCCQCADDPINDELCIDCEAYSGSLKKRVAKLEADHRELRDAAGDVWYKVWHSVLFDQPVIDRALDQLRDVLNKDTKSA